MSGVEYLRLFPRRAGSQWFEVNRGYIREKTQAEDTVTKSIRALFKAKEQEFKSNEARDIIEAGNDKTEANTWLSIVS